jgi:hypothetical protein
MAEVTNISTEKKLILNDQVTSRDISRKFGRPEDYIELHIYNTNNQKLFSEQNFTQYNISSDSVDLQSLTSEINMDPVEVLRSYGYSTGKYRLAFNIQRRKIFNTTSPSFTITEISTTRREIRAVANNINNESFDTAVKSFIAEIESSLYFKDFVLNFGENVNPLGVNILLNTNPSKHEILIKLLDPLPSSISTRDTFAVAEEISDPISLTVDLGEIEITDNSIPLQGPNFKIDIRLNNSVPSAYKNYNQVLEYSLTSSYQNLLNQLENREVPEIQYDYIRSVSSSTESTDVAYHFESFVHFGSAVERLKNFAYKVELIELYDSQISDINSITGDTSASSFVLTNKEDINSKKEKLIKGLDGYEQFLYFTSGSSFTWPKSNTSYPYTLYSVTSSQAKTWLGDERSSFPNYGGQLLSASLYDRQNEYALIRLVPNHIVDNPDNDFYQTFVHMIGHHFDTVWTHIKAITDTQDTHHTRGISKDLVYFQLKSLGIDTFDQFENSNLIEYILGHGTGSSTFYDAPSTQTLVTASNAGSIPKQDITKEVWKRLYHNAPYLLKTKGTERGLRALMSCYGVPSTILNVKEYGGPVKDQTGYKTFTYEKSGLALKGDSGTDGYFIKTDWSSSLANTYFTYFTAGQQEKKTIEFRAKPVRLETNQHLLTLSGSTTGTGTYTPANDQSLILQPYIGNDISSSDDSTQYGRIALHRAGADVEVTPYFPIFNGDFWNVFISAQKDGTDASVTFGAYQANFNKNISSYTTSSTTANYNFCWGNEEKGAKYAYFGGIPANSNANFNDIDGLVFSGSFQEIRYYFGEILSDSTLIKHALEPFMYAGNTVSSSYENLVLRLPLGSNDKQDSSSFHPNIDVEFLGNISSNMTTQQWEEVVENHYHPTPDTVGISMTSEKVRIDTGTIDDDILSVNIRSEESTLDRQPQDFEDLGVFFSPTTEINEDIVYQLGAFRLDDYIGSPLPSAQTASNYEDLKTLKDIYFKRVNKRYNYWDYVKTIQYIDHTLFKIVEQFVPFKANLKTGLLIEPHYLERSKFARELPVVDYGTTMTQGSYQTIDFQIDPERAFTLSDSSVVTTNNLSPTTGSDGKRLEKGTNTTIDVSGYILDEVQNIAQAPITPGTGVRKSNTLLGNATKGKLSRRYYRSLDKGKELDF